MSTTTRVGVDITAVDKTGPAFINAIANVKRLDAVAGNSVNRMRTLSFQMNDVFVQMAGGTNPLLIAAQQGPQIAQIYGFGNGGVAQAFKDAGSMLKGLVTRFPLVTAAAVATGLGMAVLRNEVSDTTGEATTMGETFTAAYEVIRDGLTDVVRGSFSAMPGWVGDMTNIALGIIKAWANNIIRVNVSWYEIVKAGIMTLPDVFKVVGGSAANYFIDAIQWMVNRASALINVFVDGANVIFAKLPEKMQPGKLGHMGTITLPKFDVTASAKSISESFQAAGKDLTEVWSTDYLGNFKDSVAARILADRAAAKKPEKKKKEKGARAPVDDLALEAKALFKEMMTPLEAYQARITHLNELLRKGYIDQTTYNRAVFAAQDAYVAASAALNNFTDEAGNNFDVLGELSSKLESGLTTMFDGVIDGTTSLKNAFSGMTTSVMHDVTKMFAHRAIQSLFGMFAGGLQGEGGGLYGGGLSGLLGGLFGGFRAAGGPVSSNRAYMVGENGPELFRPGRDGFITPNSAFGGGGGGGVTIIDQRRNAPAIEQTKDSRGNVRLLIRDEVNRTVGSGAADAAYQARFGAKPSRLRR